MKLNFRGHVYFEVVSPDSVYVCLAYLKKSNFFCRDNFFFFFFDMMFLTTSLINLSEDKNTDTDYSIKLPEENENPLYKHQCNSQENLHISQTLTSEEIVTAPGEGKNPNSLVPKNNCELLAFPYLFPSGKFGCDIKRDIKLNPVK